MGEVRENSIENETLRIINETLRVLGKKIDSIYGQVSSIDKNFNEFKAVQEKELEYLKKNNTEDLKRITIGMQEMNSKCSNLPCREYRSRIVNLEADVKETKAENEKQNERFHATLEKLGNKFNGILLKVIGSSSLAFLGAIAAGAVAYIIK